MSFDPCFFGYGSLVNRATHAYPGAAKATAHGWQRGWRHTQEHSYAFLTALRKPGSEIHGLIAAVPDADWEALDLREQAYERILDTENIRHARQDTSDVAIYAISEGEMIKPKEKKPILLSYLDVVVQGYLQEFGSDGAAHFFATTTGWDTPVLNDRAAPIYPRHQQLTDAETATTDAALKTLGATILTT
ncbi:MAG: gamma-glutamylcyclotransferase family protein [Aliishimia sp.]